METGLLITIIICATVLLLGIVAAVPVILFCGVLLQACKKLYGEVGDNVKSDRFNGTFGKRRRD